MSRGAPRGGAQKATGNGLLATALRGRGPLLFSLSIVLGVLVFGTIWIWNAVRARVLDTPEYRLNPHEIVVNDPPGRISASELKQEVIRDASLDNSLSILDDKLTERIALAFAAHPWVARVERVEKFHPARMLVSVVYRVPVGFVAVGSDLLPIDRTAALLPRENFSQAELERMPRIGGILSRPTLRPGNVWQDARVQGGALIAEALTNDWQSLSLAEIRPLAVPSAVPVSAITYELVTRGGKHIAWGRQPLGDDPTEPAAAEKLKRLKTYVEQHGTLENVTRDEPQPTDVPHTASAKAPHESAN